MIAAVQNLVRIIDGLNRLIGQAISWLTLGMTLTTLVIVVLRYLFDMGFIWMQESVSWMHAAVFMLGAAYTLAADEHVRVDIFYRRAGSRRRAWTDVIGSLLFLLPTVGFILWAGFDYVVGSWGIQERSREAGGLSGVYLLKTLIVLMATLLALQALAVICRNGLHLIGRDAAPPRNSAQ